MIISLEKLCFFDKKQLKETFGIDEVTHHKNSKTHFSISFTMGECRYALDWFKKPTLEDVPGHDMRKSCYLIVNQKNKNSDDKSYVSYYWVHENENRVPDNKLEFHYPQEEDADNFLFSRKREVKDFTPYVSIKDGKMIGPNKGIYIENPTDGIIFDH